MCGQERRPNQRLKLTGAAISVLAGPRPNSLLIPVDLVDQLPESTALVLILREANTLVDVSSFLVNTFSGSNFPVNSLPRWLLPVSLALPLTYGFDAVRGWLLQTRTLLPIPVEIGLLGGSMVVLIFLGLVVFQTLERRVRRRGTLGQY